MIAKDLKTTAYPDWWSYLDSHPEPHRVFRIMADFAGAYLWRSGAECSPLSRHFPDTPALKDLELRFEDWQLKFETCSPRREARYADGQPASEEHILAYYELLMTMDGGQALDVEWARSGRPQLFFSELHGDIDWLSFHEEGLALVAEAKVLIGDRAFLIYEKPSEDPHCKLDQVRLVEMTDGS